jgi:hypothetical protein
MEAIRKQFDNALQTIDTTAHRSDKQYLYEVLRYVLNRSISRSLLTLRSISRSLLTRQRSSISTKSSGMGFFCGFLSTLPLH